MGGRGGTGLGAFGASAAAVVLAVAGAGRAGVVTLGSDLTADGSPWVFSEVTVTPTGTGARGDPWVYDFAAAGWAVDLAGHTIATADRDADDRGSLTLLVESLLDSGGGGTLNVSSGDRNAGCLAVHAAGDLRATRIVSSCNVSGAYLAGDVALHAGGAVGVTDAAGSGGIDARGGRPGNAGGDVSIAAGGGVTVGADAGGLSIRTDSYQYQGGGDVRIEAPGRVALAGGIDCRGNYNGSDAAGAGSLTVGTGSARAGNVTIGGDVLAGSAADGGDYGGGGRVEFRAASLAVDGSIDLRARLGVTDVGNDAAVDVDVTGDCTVAGWIDVSNQGDAVHRCPAGEVRVQAHHIRIEGAGADGASIAATTPSPPDRQRAAGRGNVTLHAVATEDAVYDHTRTDPHDPADRPLGGDASSIYVAGGVRTTWQGRDDARGDVVLRAVGLWLGGDVETDASAPAVIDVDYGVTEHGYVTHLFELSTNPGQWVQWDGQEAMQNTYAAGEVSFEATVAYLDVLTAGDANRDGVVDVLDLAAVANHFGGSPATWAEGDFNADGVVDVLDLAAVANHFGDEAGASGGGPPAPEPGPAALVLAGAALLLVARGRRGRRRHTLAGGLSARGLPAASAGSPTATARRRPPG